MKFHKAVLLTCVLLSAILFIGGVNVLGDLSRQKQQKYNGYARVKQEYTRNEDGSVRQYEDGTVWEHPVNLLVLGLDDEEKRSDVILLVNYSPSGDKVNILSIPRDTRVSVRGRTTKINSLIATGGERLIIDRVEGMTGLPVDYFITLNFKGFREIVDTLGGVEFEIPFNMNYDDPDQDLHIHLRKGRQVLDGDRAEQLVRYRKGNRRGEGYEDGDIGRIKIQHEFIKEFIDQKMKLKYLSRADDIYFILQEHMATNIGIGDIKHYLKYLKNINYKNIEAYTVPGESKLINKIYYFIYDREETQRIISDNFFN